MSELIAILKGNLIGSGTTGFVIMTIIKSGIIMSAACLAGVLMYKMPAAGRSVVFRLALAAILLIPIFSLITPSIYIAIAAPAASPQPVTSSSQGNHEVANQAVQPRPPFLSWESGVIGIWLLGVFIIIGRAIFGYALTRKIIKKARPVESTILNELKEKISSEIGIKKQVRLVGSSSATIPFAFGTVRPVIVLPEGLQEWPEGALRMVLVHELAHIRRRDLLWLHISTLALALYWFNPLVWAVRKKMIMESDKTCDDFVLCAGAEESIYAERLVMLARIVKRGPLVINHGTGMARQSQLEERIMSILGRQKRVTGMRKLSHVILIAAAALLIVPMAAMQLRAVEPDIISAQPEPPQSEPAEIPAIDESAPVEPVSAVTELAQTVPSETEPEKLPAFDEFIPVDSTPVMIKMAQPIYPDSAKETGVEGGVYVNVLVDSKGQIRDARISKSSGSAMLDKAALNAARQCEWKPAIKDGKPIAVWVSYKIIFQMAEKSESPSKK
ncbi:membrane hypothetical protein [Candidatus Zixiibacteriota bacterium]|nr:membrane hypothetical protein [candidate division Zixibacteria bacterium]